MIVCCSFAFFYSTKYPQWFPVQGFQHKLNILFKQVRFLDLDMNIVRTGMLMTWARHTYGLVRLTCNHVQATSVIVALGYGRDTITNSQYYEIGTSRPMVSRYDPPAQP